MGCGAIWAFCPWWNSVFFFFHPPWQRRALIYDLIRSGSRFFLRSTITTAVDFNQRWCAAYCVSYVPGIIPIYHSSNSSSRTTILIVSIYMLLIEAVVGIPLSRPATSQNSQNRRSQLQLHNAPMISVVGKLYLVPYFVYCSRIVYLGGTCHFDRGRIC